MELYRFRSTHTLLDGHNELKNQEIYFASPAELNDPLEGFRDVYWRGDKILWRNFLKHYIFCLEHIYLLTIIAADTIKVSSKDIPLYNYPITNYPPHRLNITDKVRSRFFERPIINDLPKQLENRQNPIRRQELLSHLMFVQQFALKTIEDIYSEQGLITTKIFSADETTLEELSLKSGDLAKLNNEIESENYENIDKLEIFFQLINIYKQGLTLSKFSATEPEKLFSNVMFILNDFNDAFIEKLESLIYPDWYSASFLTDYRNSAIWGYYGDNHKGVCLIYEPNKISEELTMDIKMITGANMRGPTIGFQAQPFRKVQYDRKHMEIDFFKSLGRSPMAFLESSWYKDENGQLSDYSSHLYNETDKWRKDYWENFQNSLIIKIKEWEDEQEYRLTINGAFTDYSDKNNRKLQYKFEDLKGIIFGIKTTQMDKMKIVQIIKENCKKANRREFPLYQAYYSRYKKNIERQKLSLTDFV